MLPKTFRNLWDIHCSSKIDIFNVIYIYISIQEEKSSLNAYFATALRLFIHYLNEGNNAVIPEDFFQALRWNGGLRISFENLVFIDVQMLHEGQCVLFFIGWLARNYAASWLSSQKVKIWDIAYTFSNIAVKERYTDRVLRPTLEYGNCTRCSHSNIVLFVLADQL